MKDKDGGSLMNKYYLLAPGPTPIPPDVLLAMAEPIIHHRTPAYEKLLQGVREYHATEKNLSREYFLQLGNIRTPQAMPRQSL